MQVDYRFRRFVGLLLAVARHQLSQMAMIICHFAELLGRAAHASPCLKGLALHSGQMMSRLLFLLVFLLSSCAKMPDRLGVEKKFQLHGVIMRLDQQAQTATIKHDEIKGWMEPMTMEFPVPSKDEFARLSRGQTVRATVFVRDLDYHIGDIQIEP